MWLRTHSSSSDGKAMCIVQVPLGARTSLGRIWVLIYPLGKQVTAHTQVSRTPSCYQVRTEWGPSESQKLQSLLERPNPYLAATVSFPHSSPIPQRADHQAPNSTRNWWAIEKSTSKEFQWVRLVTILTISFRYFSTKNAFLYFSLYSCPLSESWVIRIIY